jgi:hypothetical protein
LGVKSFSLRNYIVTIFVLWIVSVRQQVSQEVMLFGESVE